MSVVILINELARQTSRISRLCNDIVGELVSYLIRGRYYAKIWVEILQIFEMNLRDAYKNQLIAIIADMLPYEQLSMVVGMSCNLDLIGMFARTHYIADWKMIIFGLACKGRIELAEGFSSQLFIIHHKLAVVMGLAYYGDFDLYLAAYEDYMLWADGADIPIEEVKHYMPISAKTDLMIIYHLMSSFPAHWQIVFMASAVMNDNVEYVSRTIETRGDGKLNNIMEKLHRAIHHCSYGVLGLLTSLIQPENRSANSTIPRIDTQLYDVVRALVRGGHASALDAILSHMCVPVDYDELMHLAIIGRHVRVVDIIIHYAGVAGYVPKVDTNVIHFLHKHYNGKVFASVMRETNVAALGYDLFAGDAGTLQMCLLKLLWHYRGEMPKWLVEWCRLCYTTTKAKMSYMLVVSYHCGFKFNTNDLGLALNARDAKLTKRVCDNLLAHGSYDKATIHDMWHKTYGGYDCWAIVQQHMGVECDCGSLMEAVD